MTVGGVNPFAAGGAGGHSGPACRDLRDHMPHGNPCPELLNPQVLVVGPEGWHKALSSEFHLFALSAITPSSLPYPSLHPCVGWTAVETVACFPGIFIQVFQVVNFPTFQRRRCRWNHGSLRSLMRVWNNHLGSRGLSQAPASGPALGNDPCNLLWGSRSWFPWRRRSTSILQPLRGDTFSQISANHYQPLGAWVEPPYIMKALAC